jgi:poly-gamma-glutamate capsule biosynthesis protein CapA/YwtB (metallophosphatase superfamily)
MNYSMLWRALCISLVACGFAANVHAEDTATSTPLHVIAVGDIMLGGSAAPEMKIYGYDYPFLNVLPLLQGSQIVFGNLEGPLTHRGKRFKDKQFTFRSPPDKVAPALATAGFNLVSLANNHSMDYGDEGLRDTMAALDKVGIRYAGAGMNLSQARKPAVMEIGGTRVALLAYALTFPEEFWATAKNPGMPYGHEAHVRADVAAARTHSEIVLVSFHWGQEGKTELREYQSMLAHAAIDSGADAVIGHHPHILQGIERYRDGIILYSLGNFVFGSYSKNAKTSAIARLTFRDGKLTQLRMKPINVLNPEVVFQPRILEGVDADAVVNHLAELSAPLNTVIENDYGEVLIDFDTPPQPAPAANDKEAPAP